MRHVFVLIDGTNCVLASGTNIQKLHSLSESAGYARCYQQGIGALSRTKIMDIFLAPNLEPRALDVFQTLVSLELKKEDRLYIFGYSRGAVIARILAMCIASSKHLLSAARTSGFTGSIQAQIEFLCLFDPVAGPRSNHIYRLYVPNHDAIHEPRIKNYLELLSAEESRPHFLSDSYIASKSTRKKLTSISAVSEADTTKDRQQSMTALGILKTRKVIWFPGTHSDVGGNGSNTTIALHALATVLTEFEHVSKTGNLGVAFLENDVNSIFDQVRNSGIPKEPKRKGPFVRALHIVSKYLSRRKPQPHILVQHFGHPLCKKYSGASAVLKEFPEYPLKEDLF